ncbi:hypothetical protein SAMN03159463_03988 [Mesorhizobium sp. NFR06]|nr:hypothetical protein SAMN03159463_03988 [Mesorhizobium sp. NFR06]
MQSLGTETPAQDSFLCTASFYDERNGMDSRVCAPLRVAPP